MKYVKSFLVFLLLIFMISGCKSPDEYIDKGQFGMAKIRIDREIASGELTPAQRIELENKKEIMRRIEMDFNKSMDDILPQIKIYFPEVSQAQLRAWENERSLEKMTINGKDRYFARAVPNLLRVNAEAKKRKIEIDGKKIDEFDKFVEQNVPAVIEDLKLRKKVTGKPVKMKFTYTLTVNADAVPAGELIRCWLPFPREGNERQTDIELLSVNAPEYVLASSDNLQRTLYMQKTAVGGKPTLFEISFSTTTHPQWYDLENIDIKPYDKTSELYKTNTAEKYPHLIFTPALQKLSDEVVAGEKNPYLAAKKIFKYISETYPWASAREYSTIDHIPDYVIENKHGDCGQVTLLFMALARLNGIPVHWQSGWMLHPGSVNLHDWCEMYLEGLGWVPVDQSFGRIIHNGDEDALWFYLGGLDAYRLIVNDDYAMPLFPEKQFLRSETTDFQRGEVEWKGGNLYFDLWDYHMEIEYINQ